MRLFTPAILGLLVFFGITRMPLPTLFGCAILIGLADVGLINKGRTDSLSQLMKTYPKAAVSLALALIVAGIFFPFTL